MELRFDAIWRTNAGNKNSVAGHMKCSRGPQVLHHWPKSSKWINQSLRVKSVSGKSQPTQPCP